MLTAGSLLAAGGAIAQQKGDTEEEVTVVAPRLVTRKTVRLPANAWIEEISLSRRVSYADLDLTLHTDVMELEKRIDDTAKEACGQLAELFPGDPATQDCVRDAVASARAQKDAAVAAASTQR
jgi:UrcA family protein